MRKVKCKLLLHGVTNQISGGEFDSISDAKKWVSQCWNRPFTIVRLEPTKKEVRDRKLKELGL